MSSLSCGAAINRTTPNNRTTALTVTLAIIAAAASRPRARPVFPVAIVAFAGLANYGAECYLDGSNLYLLQATHWRLFKSRQITGGKRSP